MSKYSFCLLLIFIFSCSKVDPNEKIIEFNSDNHPSGSTEEVFSSVEIIPLETSQNSLIVNVDKLIRVNNFYLILDKAQASILVFDSLGKFSHKISKQGMGPGEYGMISDFVFNNYDNTLEILSPTGQVNRYTIQGEWLGDYNIPELRSTHLFELLDQDHIVVYSIDYRLPENLVIYSKNRNQLIFKTHTGSSIFEKKFISITKSPLKKSEDQLLFTQPYGSKIFTISPEGLVKTNEWNFGDLNFKNENYSFLENRSEEEVFDEFSNSIGKKFISFINYFENKNLIFCQFSYRDEVKSVIISKKSTVKKVLTNLPTYSAKLFSNEILVLAQAPYFSEIIENDPLVSSSYDYSFQIDENDNPIILNYKLIDF